MPDAQLHQRDAVTDAAPGASVMPRLLGALSPQGRRARLTILIFHRVREQPDPLFLGDMDAASFRQRLLWIRSWFNVLPLEEAVARLAGGSLPARALAITFDDGYADNCTVALPILREFGVHATFFIATAFLDGGRMWNDTVIEAIRRARADMLDLSGLDLGRHRIDSAAARRAAIDALLPRLKYLPLPVRDERAAAIGSLAAVDLPSDLMMTGPQVAALAAAGMGIGGHTATHPILARLDAASARREMADGRDALEARLRQPVTLFAYPNGKPGEDYTAAHVRMARDVGFTAAVSTAHGAARIGDSIFELPRFTPWDRSPLRFGLRLARNLVRRASGVGGATGGGAGSIGASTT